MPTISSIGNNRAGPRMTGVWGFTFFEVMVAVIVFSLGVVMVYKAMLTTMDYRQHLTNRLFAMNLLEHEMTRFKELYKDMAQVPLDQDGAVYPVTLNNHQVPFRLSVGLTEDPDLDAFYRIDLAVSWPERAKTVRMSRSSYLSVF